MKIENTKCYELYLIDGIIRKLLYWGKQGSIYNFKYSNLNQAKKLLNISNGIYFVTKDNQSMEIYIGQTTNGVFRFTSHKMNEYQDTAEIYFYAFDGQEPNKNLLDHIERIMIKSAEASRYILLNNTSGNTSELRLKDEQYANENISTIVNLLRVFGIDFELENVVTIESEASTISQKSKHNMKRDHDELFYGKAFDSEEDFEIAREGDVWILKKGSKVKGRYRWENNHDEALKNNSGYPVYKSSHDLVDENNILQKDIVWKSISPLVAFAKGQSVGAGWTSIKNKDGKTPHQVYREDD